MQDPLALVNHEYSGGSRIVHNYENLNIKERFQIFLDRIENIVNSKNPNDKIWQLWELHSQLYSDDKLLKYLLKNIPGYFTFHAIINDKRFGAFLSFLQNGSQAYCYNHSNCAPKKWINRISEIPEMIDYINLWLYAAHAIANKYLGYNFEEFEVNKFAIKQQEPNKSENKEKIKEKKHGPGKLYKSYRHLYREIFSIGEKGEIKRFEEKRFRSWQREIIQIYLEKGIYPGRGNSLFVGNNIKAGLKRITRGSPLEK